MLVFGLNFAAHEETAPNVAHHAPPPSSQMRELLQQQERLLAELTGSNEDSEADRAKSPASPPHGKRVEEFSNT